MSINTILLIATICSLPTVVMSINDNNNNDNSDVLKYVEIS